jgi:hypothetical protein
MPARLKVLHARPDQGAPIEARAAPEDTSHVETPGLAVDVNLSVVIRPLFDECRSFVESGVGWGTPVATLEEQY